MTLPYHNVRTMRKHEKLADTLWPKNSFDSVAFLIERQQPIPVQTYPYVLKTDIPGEPGVVTVYPDGSVGYFVNTKRQQDSTIARWVKENTPQLRELSKFNPLGYFRGDMFGKTTTVNDRLIFVCYYAMSSKETSVSLDDSGTKWYPSINLDETWLNHNVLGSTWNALNGAAVAAPIDQMANMVVNTETRGITCHELGRAKAAHNLGFPVGVYRERKNSDDGAFIASTPVLMRYGAFYHQSNMRRIAHT